MSDVANDADGSICPLKVFGSSSAMDRCGARPLALSVAPSAPSSVEPFGRDDVGDSSSDVSEAVQKGAKRFVCITILAGYKLCSCPLGQLGGH
jgi:hypothetical protein